ncbi:metallophosphoesterase [Thiomicrolovo sp. ZZH C-3]
MKTVLFYPIAIAAVLTLLSGCGSTNDLPASDSNLSNSDVNTSIIDNNTSLPDSNTTIIDNNTTVPDNNTTIVDNNGTVPDNNTTSPVTPCSGTAVMPERLFLQQLGSNRVIIKWRGNKEGGAEAETVCFGTAAALLPAESETAASITAAGHREALITGLQPDTTYYYSVGGAGAADPAHAFRTAPLTGEVPSDGNTRIWLLGDAGTAGFSGIPGAELIAEQGGYDAADQIAVRDGFYQWLAANGGEPVDLMLMLGDNAYLEGTDEQYQRAVFDMYPETLATVGMWSTIGNHEMGLAGMSVADTPDLYISGTAAAEVLNLLKIFPDLFNQLSSLIADLLAQDPTQLASDSRMPYLNIHTFPTQGENGGIPSGTEQYYAFDYGNVHVVSLDSQLSARNADNRAAMLAWLQSDLDANTNDWTIVIFHHPPYTKGSHDSDDYTGGTRLGTRDHAMDQPIFDMRETFTPMFENYGVDLVYSGHSHVYERSYYLHNHTGLSDTFDAAQHAELNANGAPASGRAEEGETYTQITQSGSDDKVVYTVAGSSGQTGGLAADGPHPAHFFTAAALGSVVVDANKTALNARFIDVNGSVLDHFTLTR